MQLLFHCFDGPRFHLLGGMSWQDRLPAVQVYLQVVATFFESCALLLKPPDELALSHRENLLIKQQSE
jgi:hypothetical protein